MGARGGWQSSAAALAENWSHRQAATTVTAVKVVHTAAWVAIEASMVYALYAGLRGRSDRRAAVAGAIVAGETLVYAGNGMRCPLTELAEAFGAENGSVTNIFLPRWMARNLPAIHAPLLLLTLVLHARNLRTRPQRRGRVPAGSPALAMDDVVERAAVGTLHR